jgi:hypothetical protein
MEFDLTCSTCRRLVRILTEDLGELPRCLECGGQLLFDSSKDCDSSGTTTALDEAILSWIDETTIDSEKPSEGDGTCQHCGYAGMIRGDNVCPVCREVNPLQTPPGPPTVDCPNCGEAIVLLHYERGKTIVCPGCKYFLGCVILPTERAGGKARKGLFAGRPQR